MLLDIQRRAQQKWAEHKVFEPDAPHDGEACGSRCTPDAVELSQHLCSINRPATLMISLRVATAISTCPVACSEEQPFGCCSPSAALQCCVGHTTAVL